MTNDTLVFLLVTLALVIFACFAFYNRLILREYKIITFKKAGNQGVTIVLISDLHCTIHGKNQFKLIEKIKEQNPDLILLAGDIFDRKRSRHGAELFLSRIKNLAPIFYSLGNHECLQKKVENTKALIGKYGITLLDANYIRTNIKGMPILIAGIDDPIKAGYVEDYSQAKSMDRAFGSLGRFNDFKILISHRPESIKDFLKYDFDLVVSGHTHGGQIRIPFILNGLYSPHQGLFPKYGGGRYNHGKLTHIISRGVSFRFFLPRVFDRPEVVSIKIN